MTGERRSSLAGVTAFAAAVALTSGGEAIAAPEVTRVVVYDLVAPPELTDLARQLTEALLVQLGRDRGLVVIGENELRLLVQHAVDRETFDLCAGREDCLAKITAPAEAEKVITGHLGRWGDGYLVTLKRSDAKRVVVERTESCAADDISALRLAVVEAAAVILETAGDAAAAFELTIGPEGTKAAVVDLGAHGVSPGVAETLTQLLSLELRRFDGLSVISRDEVKTMLQFEADKQILQCTGDVDCLAEIGGALGVDYLVSGAVGRLDDTHVINLKLMGVDRSQVVHRVSEPYRGPERRLGRAMRFAVWRLLGKPARGTGQLAVEVDIDAQISIDGGEVSDLPRTNPFTGLAVGRHSIFVRAEDHYGLDRDVYVLPDQVTKLRADLAPIPTAWYESWWVWTLVGVGVAAAVSTSLIVAGGAPDDSDVIISIPGPN